MYEKHGLMSKLSNPDVLRYLRSNKHSHTRLIENALRISLGKPTVAYPVKTHGLKKKEDCRNVLPVKVVDPELVSYLITQRKEFGINHRHTIEKAILNVIKTGDKLDEIA